MDVPLFDVLSASIETFGKSAPEACRHAVILMAQSARKATPTSAARREVLEDDRGLGKYVSTYTQHSVMPKRIHQFRFSDKLLPGDRLEGTWEQAKRIKNKGLAKRSWMWGLSGADSGMHGVSKTFGFENKNSRTVGYIKQNKLSYIEKIMPAGWQASAQRAAMNKLMHNIADKIVRAMRKQPRKAA